MCGSSPRPPPPPAPDPAVEEQRQLAEERANTERAREREARTREAIARSSGQVGMRSLISGMKGGQGFRSLIG